MKGKGDPAAWAAGPAGQRAALIEPITPMPPPIR
jgi:hypothetical protein